MVGFIKYLYVMIHRKKMIKTFKPIFVFWFIQYDGDQMAIRNAMKEGTSIKNDKYIAETLKGVNLNDYSFILEKDFKDYRIYDEDVILRKADANLNLKGEV